MSIALIPVFAFTHSFILNINLKNSYYENRN
nr:MAG TPA: hypothetical protein [Caudoviricetes sp.]